MEHWDCLPGKSECEDPSQGTGDMGAWRMLLRVRTASQTRDPQPDSYVWWLVLRVTRIIVKHIFTHKED